MFHSGNVNLLPVLLKADPVITDAQPKLRRFDILQTLYVAFTSFQKPIQGMQNAHCGDLVNGAKLSSGFRPPDNVLVQAY